MKKNVLKLSIVSPWLVLAFKRGKSTLQRVKLVDSHLNSSLLGNRSVNPSSSLFYFDTTFNEFLHRRNSAEILVPLLLP